MWMKLTNSDFKTFKIEAIQREGTLYKDEFYVTHSTLSELQKLLDSDMEDEMKLRSFGFLLSKDGALNEGEAALKSIYNMHHLLLNNAFIGQNRFLTKRYKYTFMGDSNLPDIIDGVLFKEKSYEREVKDVIHFKYGEYVLASQKQNVFGEFKGFILTNLRLISVRTKEGTYSIDWKDIKNIKKKFLGDTIINDQYIVRGNDLIFQIIESMIEYDFMEYPIILRGDSLSGKFGMLSFDRYTFEEFEGIQEGIEELKAEHGKITGLYLYNEKTAEEISVKEGDLVIEHNTVGKVEKHPKKKGAYILRNLTKNRWRYTIDDKKYTIEPSKARALIPECKIVIDGSQFLVKQEG